MPVSSSLQKYFDSQRQRDGEMQRKFDTLAGQIDPAFAQSFAGFRDRILNIVEENEEHADIVGEELDSLGEKLEDSNGKHQIKKSAALYNASN